MPLCATHPALRFPPKKPPPRVPWVITDPNYLFNRHVKGFLCQELVNHSVNNYPCLLCARHCSGCWRYTGKQRPRTSWTLHSIRPGTKLRKTDLHLQAVGKTGYHRTKIQGDEELTNNMEKTKQPVLPKAGEHETTEDCTVRGVTTWPYGPSLDSHEQQKTFPLLNSC